MRRRFLYIEKEVDINNYLTIEALEDNLTASLSTHACEYCIDGDGKWMQILVSTETQSINKGQTLSFRGGLVPFTSRGIGTFTVNKNFNLKGNVMSMLFGDAGKDNYSLNGKSYAFYDLFRNCTTLKSVSNNFLPATTLADNCYSYMFEGCTNLTNAPELPATALNIRCYNNMFRNCTNLTTAPSILPATTLAERCCYDMFYGCTNLTTAPELPATTLASLCYSYMFYGCSGLTTAPVLPATTLASSCYSSMFEGCSKLNYIKMLATDISASRCLSSWVSNVSSTGTFVKNPAMTSLPTATSSNNYAGIPSGWTVVDDGEESGGNLITFTLEDAGGDIYNMEAESGMTWQDFVNSKYNNGDFSIGRFMGYKDVALFYVDPIHSSDGVRQHATNTITANGSYFV